jgi:hypothetical protein
MATPAVRIGRPPLPALLALLLALIAGLSAPPLAAEQTTPIPAVSAATTRHSDPATPTETARQNNAAARAETARHSNAAAETVGHSNAVACAETARHGDACSVTVGPAGAPVAAEHGDPVVRGRERVLRTQQFFAVRAARAPPAATI